MPIRQPAWISQDALEPDADLIAEMHVADHGGVGGDVVLAIKYRVSISQAVNQVVAPGAVCFGNGNVLVV